MAGMPVTRVVLYKHGVGYFEREGTVEGDQSVGAGVQAGRGQRRAQVADDPRPRRRAHRVGLVRLDQAAGGTAGRGCAVDPRGRGPGRALAPAQGGAGQARRGRQGGRGNDPGARHHSQADRRRRGRGRTPLAPGRRRRDPLVRAPRALRAHRSSTRPSAGTSISTSRPQLSAKKKDARSFSIFARGEGERRLRLAYTVAAPVWKATYRLILGEEDQPPMIQGWAVVDNTQDEDWENVAPLARRRPAGLVRPRPLHAALHPPARRRGQGDDRRAAAGGRGREWPSTR